jgi:hypothetical protein
MFSLSIATMDRFDTFLVKYLSEYINNQHIDEIIITDENGNDVDKIRVNFPNNNKFFPPISLFPIHSGLFSIKLLLSNYYNLQF